MFIPLISSTKDGPKLSIPTKLHLHHMTNYILRLQLWPWWYGIVVRHWAHKPKVVGLKPALATIEDSILGQGVNTNCASLHPGV